MIPVGDIIPTRTRPFITLALMAVTIAVGGPLVPVAANLVALWLFARAIEDRLGHDRMVVFVVLCGTAAAFARTLTSPILPLGAAAVSGAVASIVAAYFVLYPRSKVLVLIPVGWPPPIVEAPAVFLLAIWFLMQVVGGLSSPAGFAASPIPGLLPSWGHLVGLAAGAAAVFVFRRPERQRVEWWNELQPR